MFKLIDKCNLLTKKRLIIHMHTYKFLKYILTCSFQKMVSAEFLVERLNLNIFFILGKRRKYLVDKDRGFVRVTQSQISVREKTKEYKK